MSKDNCPGCEWEKQTTQRVCWFCKIIERKPMEKPKPNPFSDQPLPTNRSNSDFEPILEPPSGTGFDSFLNQLIDEVIDSINRDH